MTDTPPVLPERTRLAEGASMWLDSWADRRTNTNEIARAHAQLIGAHIASLHARNQALESAYAKAGEALEKYGQHFTDCMLIDTHDTDCSCGFRDALRSLPKVPK